MIRTPACALAVVLTLVFAGRTVWAGQSPDARDRLTLKVEWTLRGAALHKEPMTAGVLRKKMEVRISFGRYFEPRGEGRYARKAG